MASHPTTSLRHRLAAAGAGGAVLAVSRPPLDWGPLVIVGICLIVWSWRSQSCGRAALLGFVAGATYYTFLVSWAWYFGAIAIVPFVAILALSMAGIGAAVALLEARWGLRSPWFSAATWVILEAGLARWPLGGFSWGEMGSAWHDIAPIRKLAAVGGVPLLTFVTVAFAGFLLEMFQAAKRQDRSHLLWAGVGMGALVLVIGGGAIFPAMSERSGTLRFALLQGNDLNRDLTPVERAIRYLPASHLALAEDLTGKFDLVVFPESSLDDDPRTDSALRKHLTHLARRLDTWVLTNSTALAPDRHVFNMNYLYQPDGRLVGTYAKRHLVPFGEWVPWRSFLSWIPELDQTPYDHAPGEKPGVFRVKDRKITTVICFESAFAHEVRPLIREGAELIVVSTNNHAFRRSANSAQHVALSQLRAVETERSVLHAANSGVSAVVDARGDIRDSSDLFERTVLGGVTELRTGKTLYVRFGDWIVLLSLGLLGVSIFAKMFSKKKRRSQCLDSADTGISQLSSPPTFLDVPGDSS